MASQLPLAPLLGALVHLTRYEPDAAEAQTAVLGVIRSLLDDQPLRIVAEREALVLNEERLSLLLPGATLINEQMLLHGIAALELPIGVAESDLLRLITVLAAFPGTYGKQEEVLAALGKTAERIRVIATDDAQEVYRLSGRARVSSGDHKTQARDELDLQRVDADEISAGAGDLEEGTGVFPEGEVAPVRMPLGTILAQGREAAATQDWERLLEAGLQLVEAEDLAPSERTGRTYRLELKRLISLEQLEALARLAHGERRLEVIGLLRRFGAAGTETLVELLVASPQLAERRSYYTAITQMRSGAEAIFGRLDDPLWYVARNAAELCGDMEIEDAVPSLGRQTQHADERVRKSVAGALARIGTPLAVEWLRKMLSDPTEGVRRQALAQLAGAPARQLSAAVIELLDREDEPEVQREALLALGRSGSEEAVATLTHWAAPVSRRFGRTPLPLRLLAIKGLALVGPPAATALSNLTRDSAEEVRTAAGAVLEGLRV
jgi:HEAT repeat protein/PBS lyase HEAT-like repeat-containing protein